VKISLGVFLLLGICAYFYRFLAVWGVPFHALRHGNLSHSYAWIWKCSLWEYDLNTSEYVGELLLENRQDAFFFALFFWIVHGLPHINNL